MKVLITGGAGYIGSELVRHLSTTSNVDEIIVYDNLSRGNFNLFIGTSKLYSNKIKFVDGEILDSRKLEKIMADCDIVFHFAAQVSTPFADVNHHLFEQVNHWGTSGVVHAAEKSNIKKFVYMSSVSVYGSGDESFSIDSTPQPQTIYGIFKLRGEEQVRRISNRIPTYILRCGNVFGYSKSMRFDAVINKFMFEGHFKNRITIQGNGDQSRAFIHIDNVIRALDNIINDTIETGTYNLVDSNRTVMDIAKVLKAVYPELEMIFISQHLKLRALQVEYSKEQNKSLGIEAYNLQETLEQFKAQFTF